MANTTAYVVLFAWPVVVFLLFRSLPRPQALAWSIIGGYLALPHAVGINLPALPTLDKTLIPALSAALMCLLGVAPFGLAARRTAGRPQAEAALPPARARREGQNPAPNPAETASPSEPPAGPAFTRQTTRHRARGAAPPAPAATDQLEAVRLPRIFLLLVALLFATHGLTYLQNQDAVRVGAVILPGLRPYDMASLIQNSAIMLLPFLLGLMFLATDEAQAVLLKVFCLAALIYTLPTLFEIRMSPQLSNWIYGFLAQSFAQTMRDGGFRPVVFLQHGLWLALFMAMASLAGLVLWRLRRGTPRLGGPGWLWAALWLALVLSISRSLGAFAILLLMMPVVLFLTVRAQLLVAAVLAAVVLVYPVLREAGLVPVNTVHDLAASINEERAQSLKFRLDNEDMLLARANERPLAGWGGYGRQRLYDAESGQAITVTDGAWIVVIGASGFLGYVATFGLLGLPVILLFLRSRTLGVTQVTAGLCLIMGANLTDMIANATLTPLTWLIAGALAGRCRFRLPAASGGAALPAASPPAAPPPRQRARPALRRLALALALLVPAMAMPARADQPEPTLSFGLTTVSDWSTQMPFLDLMKMSRDFMGHTSTQWNAMPPAELEAGGHLDAQGWPTRIPPGMDRIGTLWDWGNSGSDPAAAASRKGVYVLDYQGAGSLQVQGAGVRVLSAEPGRMLVENTTGGAMTLDITATDPAGTGDYIRNITLVAQEHEALFEAGQIFNPDWLELVQDARELRFKDWMGVDGVTSANWADRPQVDDVNWRPVPVEVMVQLANQTGTEPWFTMPAGATEEYIRNFATYVRDTLDPGLEVHVEYSNELWNWAYPQTQWLAERVTADWGIEKGGPEWLDYHAMLATKSALIWDEVFGPEGDARLDLILGTQTVNPWLSNRLLNAPMWQTQDPEGYVPPHEVFESLAIATYFGVATLGDNALRDELVTTLHTPGVDATEWLAGKLMDPDYPSSIPQLLQWCAEIKAVADQYGIDLISYEGGAHVLHSWAVSGMSEADIAEVQDFLITFTRSQAMADLYQALWDGWAKVGDGPFMQFLDVEAPSKYGAFGLFSALGDTNPRAELLMRLNATTPPWFEAP